MTSAGREMDRRRRRAAARAALMMAAAGHGTVRAALCQLPPAEEHGTMSIQSRTSISRGPQRISESVSMDGQFSQSVSRVTRRARNLDLDGDRRRHK
jgi:hypothetical protein